VDKEEIAPILVAEQLSQILLAAPFQNSTILSRFLTFIVEETLAGHKSELKEYTIGLKALSKRRDFSPQLDPAVRIHAGRLRRTLNEYYLTQGKNDELIISIPKGSYIPEFSIRSKLGGIPMPSNREGLTSTKKITVAVMPFRNINPDTTAATFADGLGDHISNELTRYTELSVVSYYSSRNIINKTQDVREAGLMLDAKYVLTGSVQIDNTRLRVSVQLILTETREQIWANAYERKSAATELFEIQDEIVMKVVSQTAGHYGAISRNVSRIPPHRKNYDPRIYNAIFWYYHFTNEVTEALFFRAEAALQEAVETDPDYALGWAVLGEIFIGGYFMGYKSKLTEQQLEMAVTYGKKAIKIDPICQHGYQTIVIGSLFLHKKDEALKGIEEWSKIRPGAAGIMGAMGFGLICCGEYEKGFKMLDESINLNPYYQWFFNGGIGFYYFKKDEFADTMYWAEKMNMPNVPWELLLKTASLAEMNRIDDARNCCCKLLQDFPFLRNVLEDYVKAFLQDKLLVEKLYNALLKAGIKEL